MSRTAADALRAAQQQLAARGISITDAAADATELVSRLLGLTRSALRLEPACVVSDDDARVLDGWIERRLAGEPVQYITGRAAFRSLDLAVDQRVLVPRPETEGLVEAVLGVLVEQSQRWRHPRVLDLGTGSGAIALAIAQECPAARVTATDASEAALELARLNSISTGLAAHVAFAAGHWFEAVGADDRFEVVVSNPPYIATGEWDDLADEVRKFEPHAALFSGPSGLDALREIIELAPRHLVTGGLLALELAESRASEVAAWLDGAHDWSDVVLRDDLAGQPRVLLARRERGPAIAPLQWPEEN